MIKKSHPKKGIKNAWGKNNITAETQRRREHREKIG
jgi:hypothetical protein